jgi:hypothetical protein
MKKRTQKRTYVRLGCLEGSIGKVVDQYSSTGGQATLCHHLSAWNIAFLESVAGKQSVIQDNKIDKNNDNSTKEQELSSKTKKRTTTKEQELEILFQLGL